MLGNRAINLKFDSILTNVKSRKFSIQWNLVITIIILVYNKLNFFLMFVFSVFFGLYKLKKSIGLLKTLDVLEAFLQYLCIPIFQSWMQLPLWHLFLPTKGNISSVGFSLSLSTPRFPLIYRDLWEVGTECSRGEYTPHVLNRNKIAVAICYRAIYFVLDKSSLTVGTTQFLCSFKTFKSNPRPLFRSGGCFIMFGTFLLSLQVIFW